MRPPGQSTISVTTYCGSTLASVTFLSWLKQVFCMQAGSDETTLSARLGGEPGLSKLVMDFLGDVLSDHLPTRFFDNVEMDTLVSTQKKLLG